MRDYYLLIDGQQVGPYTAEQLHELLAQGQLTAESPAWYDGLPDWVQLGTILEDAAPSAPAPVAPAPTRKVTAAPAPAQVAPITPAPYTGVVQTNVKQGALLGGLVCFLLGMVFMYFSLFTFIFYGPLFLVALILSIVAMAQGRVAGGVILLLVSLVVPTIFGLILFSERASRALASYTTAPSSQAAPVSVADSASLTPTTTPMDTAPTPASSTTNTNPVVISQPSSPQPNGSEPDAPVTNTTPITNAAPVSPKPLAKVADPGITATSSEITSNDASPTSSVTNAAPAAAAEATDSTDTVQPPPKNQISEAFGMKLGDVFDPSQAVKTGTLTDGTQEYDITPVNALRSFTDYYVLITPETHKIYAIEAQGDFDNTDMAKNEQAVVMKLLTDKYGAVGDQTPDEIMSNGQHIIQGNRYVITKILGFTPATLLIGYFDGDLKTLAEKERVEMEAKKVDAGGL